MILNPFETMKNMGTVEVVNQAAAAPMAQQQAPAPEAPKPTGRAFNVSDEDWEEAKHVLYGEISDRDYDKQVLEAETILNTAFNRIGQYSEKGKNLTLAQVLQEPNQYQAYMPDKPDSLYSMSKRGEYAEGGERRVKAIEDVFNRAKTGALPDNTNGAVFYIHHPDGRIEYDDTKKLYAE